MASYRDTYYAFLLCIFTNQSVACSHEIITSVHSDISVPSGCLIKTPNKGIDIKKVMDYQMPSIIARYRKDYKVSEEDAKVHEIELKRWLILAADAQDGESLGMMSDQVDNLWHTFLLFTKEYQVFCNDMFGKFIHHCPTVNEN